VTTTTTTARAHTHTHTHIARAARTCSANKSKQMKEKESTFSNAVLLTGNDSVNVLHCDITSLQFEDFCIFGKATLVIYEIMP